MAVYHNIDIRVNFCVVWMGNHLLVYMTLNKITVTGRKDVFNSNEDFQSFVIKTFYVLGL